MEYGNGGEREINLMDLGWEILTQWKPLLLCAMIGVIIMFFLVCTSRNRNVSETKTVVPVETGDIERDINNIKDRLTPAQIKAVEKKVDDRRSLEEIQDKIEGYDVLQHDVDRLHYITLLYTVNSNNISTGNIIEAYRSFISSSDEGSLKSRLYDENNAYESAAKIIEVVKLTPAQIEKETECNTFTVSVVKVNGIDDDRINQIIEECLVSAHDLLAESLPHSINLVSSYDTTSIERNFADSYWSYCSRIPNMTVSVRDLSDDQLALYRLLLIRDGIVTPDQDQDGAGNIIIIKHRETSFEYRNIILGFIIGAFLYLVFVILRYALDGKVKSLSEACNCYHVRGLDEIHMRKIDTAFKKFIYSRRIYRWHYRRSLFDMSDHISLTTSRITEIAAQNKFRNVSILPACKELPKGGAVFEYTKKLKSELGNSSIDVTIDMSSVGDHGEKTIHLDNGSGVVIFMKANDTSYKLMDSIISYCRDYDVRVIGAVLVEE